MFLFSFSCVRIPQLCGPNIRHVHIRQFEKDKGEKKGNSWFSPYLSWRISSFPSPLFLAFPLLSSFPFGLLTLLPALHSPKKRRREGDNGDEKGSQGGEWKEMKPATPYKSGFFFSSPPVLSRGQRFVPRSEVARRRGAPMRLSWKRDGCLTFKVFFSFSILQIDQVNQDKLLVDPPPPAHTQGPSPTPPPPPQAGATTTTDSSGAAREAKDIAKQSNKKQFRYTFRLCCI